MVDTVNREMRSHMMASVKAKNTKPELSFRRRLFAMVFRYRLHRKDLSGTPDIVFPKYRAVMFVHGCFWLLHGCRLSTLPGTRRGWWKTKLENNLNRDSKVIVSLKDLGWRIIVIWECIFRKPKTDRSKAIDEIAGRIGGFLKSGHEMLEIPSSDVHEEDKVSGKYQHVKIPYQY